MTRFQANPDYVQREIRGEKLLVPIAGEMGALDSLFTLNETASLIWDLACAGQTTEEIASELQNQFDVTAQEALNDAQQILTELQALEALIPLEQS